MISGPDLGGGYLHQLSFEPADGGGTTFTFHAQEGGSDAGGPPQGPLDPFGCALPPAPCMFGGPRCWHRRFLLSTSDAPRVRQAYHPRRFVLAAMLDQTYTRAPVAVNAGLEEVLARIARPLEAEGVAWFIGGSVAALLQGASVRPRDLDLGTDRVGVDRIATLLADYLIEPVAPTDWPGRGFVRGARAFVGSFAQGLRVEWAFPLESPLSGSGDRPDEFRGPVRTERVEVGGRSIAVTRPEYALVRAAEKGDGEHRGAVLDLLRRIGPDRALLEELLAGSALSAPGRESLRTELFA